MPSVELIICLGKNIYDDGSLDNILKLRVEKAVEVFLSNPNSRLILTGGKGYSDTRKSEVSEAEAMYKYVAEKYPNLNFNNIIVEKNGKSTINQLCLIKKEVVLPNNYRKIALVTDEVHMKRALAILDGILGDDYTIVSFPSKIDIVGLWRRLIENDEANLYDKTINNLIKRVKRGDEDDWLIADQEIAKNLHKTK
ncbi:MAG: YdcF family protein [Bacillota bacterium]|nr:YdcF family protein [Bacillota bacterium]